MKIGLCFDLRQEWLDQGYSLEETAEFDSPETVEAIEQALTGLGYDVERIGGAQALARALSLGARWDLVFNIAEGLHGLGRESLAPALLEAWRIPFVFSDTLATALCLHKAVTKHVIRDMGLPTPDFCLVETQADIQRCQLRFPVFAKPVAEGTGKGIGGASICEDAAALTRVCAALLQRFRQPVLVEELLEGREFTVGLVGTGAGARVLGVMEVLADPEQEHGAYGFATKADYEQYVSYALCSPGDPQARRAGEVALAAYRGLGLRDGGRLDLRAMSSAPNSEVHFIEANPLAGLHPRHSDLPILCRLAGISYAELLRMIVDSALQRHGMAPVATPGERPLAA